MRKIIILILLCVGLLSGCGKNKVFKEEDVIEYLEDLKSYSLTSVMKINKMDKAITMDVSVDYKEPNLYKVTFGKDNEQIILKNEKGVYVITPNLNKEFKFDGTWPNNSSHAYLLDSIGNNLKKDENSVITTNENDITIESKVTHKTNSNITKMKYTCDKKMNPIKTVFLDDSNKEIVIVEFKTFNANPTFEADHFSEAKYLKKDVFEPNESETSLVLEAGFVVDGSVLETSKTTTDLTILCYSGDKPYTILVSKVKTYPEVVVIEEYNDVVVLECGLGLVDENVFVFYMNDYEFRIYSNHLSIEEFEQIASNITLS